MRELPHKTASFLHGYGKSPKRLISYIRMKMTPITDVNKHNKRRIRVFLFHLDNSKYLPKVLNLNKYKVKKTTEAMK